MFFKTAFLRRWTFKFVKMILKLIIQIKQLFPNDMFSSIKRESFTVARWASLDFSLYRQTQDRFLRTAAESIPLVREDMF